MNKLLLITMGGTIDAAPYSEIDGEYPADAIMTGENRAVAALRTLFNASPVYEEFDVEIIALCDKDSKEITAADRDALFDIIVAADEKYHRIIVTMGTDRMSETAKDILSRKPPLKCPLVFTGAIWPLANGIKRSDGWSNLGHAVHRKAADHVYIAMGTLFARAENVFKDFAKKEFVERFPA